jgi:predicted transposase YdaD
MEDRLAHETAPAEAATLWVSTYLLMGLRYPPAVAAQLLQGVRAMKESSTYQAILDEGRAEGRAEGETIGRIEEALKVLLLLGGKQFGPPNASTRATIEAADLERLERLTERLLDVSSWDELLASA